MVNGSNPQGIKEFHDVMIKSDEKLMVEIGENGILRK